MKQLILLFAFMISVLPAGAQALSDKQLVVHLQQVYNTWRGAMMKKNATVWQKYTATHRIIEVRNRIWSERNPFPQAVFASPVAPPDITRLKALRVRVKGRTAKAIYYGKVDFGVEGKPTDNIFVVSYVLEGNIWKYDAGEFVKLDLIPEVKRQIQAGDYQYFDQADFHPNGLVPSAPVAISGPAKYIAKAYVFCPGREVELKVNRISTHLFQNDKRAEIVVGGARDGQNTVEFTVKNIPGGDPKAPMTIRVYLMSEIPGTQPIKILQYQVENGEQPKKAGTLSFNLTPEVAAKLRR